MSTKEIILFCFFSFFDLSSRAMRKICSYDEFVPYYNQLIKQIMTLLGN